jgi:hypothetical protein
MALASLASSLLFSMNVAFGNDVFDDQQGRAMWRGGRRGSTIGM